MNENRQAFDLALSRFEFPTDDWLYVIGEVDDGSRTWRFEDPCLTAREVRQLAAWLRRIADDKTNRSAIDFLEPNLAFEMVGRSGSRVVIRVILELEARPPWNDRALADDEWRSVWLDFPLTLNQLRAASAELHTDVVALEARSR